MKAKQIIQYLGGVFPTEAAMDFDNVGLLIGDEEENVDCIYVTIDVTERTIAEAKAAGAQMIVSHHPVIFSGLKKITPDTVTGRRVLSIVSDRMLCYAAHTNYDVFRMGHVVEEKLGLTGGAPLEVTWMQDGLCEGIGRIGELPDRMTLKEFGEKVKKVLGVGHVRLFGDPDHVISRVSLCPGSGKSVIEDAVRKQADVLIAGDIGHHEGIDAAERGLAIIDPGHYGSETVFIDDMSGILKKEFPVLKIVKETVRQPLWSI